MLDAMTAAGPILLREYVTEVALLRVGIIIEAKRRPWRPTVRRGISKRQH
jgi:hypothetical protein